MSQIIFAEGSVPVSIAAKVFGKDACWIRAGIIAGWLSIGTATRSNQRVEKVEEIDSRLGRINFYISPKKSYMKKQVIFGEEKSNGY